MSISETMSEHLSIFFEIFDKLKQIEKEIVDDFLFLLLFYSVPETFKNFRCAMKTRDELPKPDSLKIIMLEEAKKGKTSHDSQNKYYIYNRRNNQEQKKNEKWNPNKIFPTERYYRNFKCNYCTKIRHKASECRKKKSLRP